VLIVREGHDTPLSVYMIRRRKTMRFMGGYYAFPGGKVEAGDAAAATLARCRGLVPEAAARLVPASDGIEPLAYWVAAARELLEEAGVVWASDADGAPIDVTAPDVTARMDRVRRALLDDTVPLPALLEAEGWYLDLAAFRYLSHFITPPASPIRFTARFFLTTLPPGQDAVHGDEEASESLWIDPAEGYRRFRRGEMPMADPAESALGYLSGFDSVDALWAAHADGRHKFHGILDRISPVSPDAPQVAHAIGSPLPPVDPA
jgi:8-oxo-dGTP pyrophosphatase MutT (NUDIX family)